MPRDLRMYRARLRSPPCSRLRSSSQVSISEEMPTSDCSAALPPPVRLVSRAVICRSLRKSIRRESIAVTSNGLPTEMRLVMGSMTTTCGAKRSISSCMVMRWLSRPQRLGRDAWKRSKPLRDPRGQVNPDRAHVAHDLIGGFLEGKIEGALAALAGGPHERGGQAALAGPGRAGHQDRAAAVVAFAAQHRVEPRHARRDALAGGRMLQAQRGDRKHH